MSFTLTDQMTTRSAADKLGSTWLRSVLRRVLLSERQEPDNFAVPITSEAPLDSAKMLTQKSVQMPRSNAGVLRDEQRTASRNNLLKEVVGRKEIRKELKE